MEDIVLERGDLPKMGSDLTAQCDKVTLSLLRHFDRQAKVLLTDLANSRTKVLLTDKNKTFSAKC